MYLSGFPVYLWRCWTQWDLLSEAHLTNFGKHWPGSAMLHNSTGLFFLGAHIMMLLSPSLRHLYPYTSTRLLCLTGSLCCFHQKCWIKCVNIQLQLSSNPTWCGVISFPSWYSSSQRKYNWVINLFTVVHQTENFKDTVLDWRTKQYQQCNDVKLQHRF